MDVPVKWELTGFSVYLADEDKAYVIDARETAVKSASQNMYVDHPSNSTYGPSAIATPGEVMGLWVGVLCLSGCAKERSNGRLDCFSDVWKTAVG